jgi:uncharacterized protein involved in exopolysaccharide biosynthesis
MAETYTSRTLREILRIIASRFLGIVIIIAVVVGGVAVASIYAPRWYRSEVQLMATPSRMAGPLETTVTSMREQVSLFVATQREIVKSDYVLATALYLLDHPEIAPKESVKKDNGDAHKLDIKPEVIENYITEHSERLMQFEKRVSIVTPGGPDATFTQVFKIRVDWPEIRGPQGGIGSETTRREAADDCYKLANYLVRAYKSRYQELEEQRAQAATSFIKKTALVEARKMRDKAGEELSKYSERLGPNLMTVTGIIGLQGVDSGSSSQVTGLETDISDIDSKLAKFQAMKTAMEIELVKKDYSKIAVPDEIISANIAISALQQKITALKLSLNYLRPQYTEEYRPVVNTRQELAEAYVDMRNELVKQKERTDSSIAILDSMKKELESRLKYFQDRMTLLGSESIKYEQLQKEFYSAMRNYDVEQKQLFDAIRVEGLARNPILLSILDDPSRPNAEDPRRPVMWLNILIACAAGIVLALAYAFLADHFDHTLKSIDDAERYLGTPVVSSVPRLGRRIIRTR